MVEQKDFVKSGLDSDYKQSYKKDSFKSIQVRCPICGIQKVLKIPTNLINPSLNFSIISIPKDYLCEHNFEILLDKSFVIKKYQFGDYNTNKIKLSPKEHLILKITSEIKKSIDNREVLGAAIFDNEWRLMYASIPSEILINFIKEINLGEESLTRDIMKIYIELSNQQKIFIENLNIVDNNYFLFLLFSLNVNFGIGTMLFKDIKDKLQKFDKNYKKGIM